MTSGAPSRLLSSTQLTLFLLAGALAYAGDYFSLPFLSDLALLCFGLLLALFGAATMAGNLWMFRFENWESSNLVRTYRAVIDELWGVIFGTAGLLMVGATFVKWLVPGAAKSIWEDLLTNTTAIGLVLAFAGLMAILTGVVRVLSGGRGNEARPIRGLTDLLDRLAGFAYVLFGLALSAGGLFLLLAPGFRAQMIEELMALLRG
jgi:hypothetical protein